jgi:ubiquinone/menaquinone biosynthesis C-methylase UbiE
MSANQDQEVREAWRRAAEGWERRAPQLRETTALVARWLVDAIDPQPGETILEVAAGPGETGFLAAERLGDGGTLISSDQSPEMVDVARRRAAELGLENVRFEVIDAQQMAAGLGPVDAVVCRWGVMLMGEPDRALSAIHGVLREGGRFSMATWATPDRNLWMAVPGMQLVARGLLPRPDPNAPGPFAMPDPEALAGRLATAGFKDVKADKIEFVMNYPSFDEYWAITLDMAAPIVQALESLDDAAKSDVREGVRGALGQFSQPDGGLDVPATAVVAAGRA